MRVERTLLENLAETVFNIGYEGEKNHVQVVISCPVMFRDHPDAVASMVVRPPQGDLYPVSLTRSGNDLTWDVSAADVANSGSGTLQLTFTDGEGDDAEVIKTVYGAYSVNASLMANGEAPDPVQSWLDEAGAALATFETEVGEIRKITTATAEDEGKALSPKTVVNGKVTEWEYIDTADPEAIQEAVDNWLDDHPEATTTVEDGAITEAKLNDSLKADLAWKDDVDGLMSAITQEKAPVILDNATGEIVTVPDGADGMKVETLTVEIEPVQDLHGQSNPYPAGGGKNLIPLTVSNLKSINTTGTWSGNVYSIYTGTVEIQTDASGNVIGLKVNGTFTTRLDFRLFGAYGDTTAVIPSGHYKSLLVKTTDNVSLLGGYGTSVDFNGTTLTDFTTANGISYCMLRITADVSINEVVKPMVCLSTASDPTVFAPYSNLCPISGWTGSNVEQTGKNLLNNQLQNGAVGGVTFTKNADGSVTLSGQVTNKDYTKNISIQTLPVGSYFLTGGVTNKINLVVRTRDENGNTIQNYTDTGSGVAFTVDESVYDILVRYFTLAVGTQSDCISYPQIVHGSSAMPYEQYNEQKKTYSFPQTAGTVYGGTLTVNADGTGTLVADRAIKDLSSITWSNIDGRGRRYQIFSDILPQTVLSVAPAKFNAENYKTVANNDLYNDTSLIGITLNDNYVYVRTGDENTPTGNLVYPLATPVTYNLTALEVIELLKGINNVWADCGNVSIEYPADTKLYIDKKLAASQTIMELIVTANRENEMKATKAYTSGNLIIVNGTLYRATTSIANGATLTVGTNVTATNIATELANLA